MRRVVAVDLVMPIHLFKAIKDKVVILQLVPVVCIAVNVRSQRALGSGQPSSLKPVTACQGRKRHDIKSLMLRFTTNTLVTVRSFLKSENASMTNKLPATPTMDAVTQIAAKICLMK